MIMKRLLLASYSKFIFYILTGKYLWISYDKDGCSYNYFFWLLSSGNFIQ